MRIGLLTGGGDCPGLNAVIRAVVRKSKMQYGWEVMGIRNGWSGLLHMDVEPHDLGRVSGILPKGGTILGTSRTNPFKTEGAQALVSESGGATSHGVLLARALGIPIVTGIADIQATVRHGERLIVDGTGAAP